MKTKQLVLIFSILLLGGAINGTEAENTKQTPAAIPFYGIANVSPSSEFGGHRVEIVLKTDSGEKAINVPSKICVGRVEESFRQHHFKNSQDLRVRDRLGVLCPSANGIGFDTVIFGTQNPDECEKFKQWIEYSRWLENYNRSIENRRF